MTQLLPPDLHTDCSCLADPRDVIDLKTWLYQANGGRLYRLLLLTQASAVLMGDGSSVETRLNTMERNLAMNTNLRFADDIAHRNALTGWIPGDACYVKDASADPQVGKGPALYIWLPELKWAKVWAMLDTLNIIKKNGGLAVDEETGRIYVDFATAASKADFLKSLVDTSGALGIDASGLLSFDLAQTPASQRSAFMALVGPAIAGSGLKWKDARLNVDFSAMPAAEQATFLSGVGSSLAGSGLSFSGGKLNVDFSANDAGVKKILTELMDKMHIPVMLEKNTTFYVDAAQSASIPASAVERINGAWGQSEARAFKDLQTCVDFISANLNVGSHTLTILVAPGVYSGGISLPDFSRTSGKIVIRSKTGGQKFNMNCAAANGAIPRGVVCLGGNWELADIAINYLMAYTAATPKQTLTPVSVSAGSLRLCDHALNITLQGAQNHSYGFNAYGCASAGRLYFDLGNYGSSSVALMRSGGNTAEGSAFSASGQAYIYFYGSLSQELAASSPLDKFYISGPFATIGTATGGHISISNTRASYVKLVAQGDLDAKKFNCINGGTIQGSNNGAYFPGETAGTVEAATYSWCK